MLPSVRELRRIARSSRNSLIHFDLQQTNEMLMQTVLHKGLSLSKKGRWMVREGTRKKNPAVFA